MILLQATENPGFISSLLENYGLTGLAFGILLYLILRQNKAASKRIEDLEAAQEKRTGEYISAHKEMIEQYVELVRNKTQILSDLTACLRAMKDTLDRMASGK